MLVRCLYPVQFVGVFVVADYPRQGGAGFVGAVKPGAPVKKLRQRQRAAPTRTTANHDAHTQRLSHWAWLHVFPVQACHPVHRPGSYEPLGRVTPGGTRLWWLCSHMAQLINLTGRLFNQWTIIERTENSKNGGSMWLARCSCTAERIVSGNNLRRGLSKSCGHVPDLTGQAFGPWTVIDRAENDVRQDALWWCRCLCGVEKVVRGGSLRSVGSKSCGGHGFDDLTGQVFGELTVMKRTENRDSHTMWFCRCSCGNKKDIRRDGLLSGKSKTCGADLHRASFNQGHINGNGYRLLYRPGHPNAMKRGWILEHVVVMSELLRRPLLPGENVHHKNGIRDDNRPENLELWVTMQPSGQRVEDLVAWAREVLDRYEECLV